MDMHAHLDIKPKAECKDPKKVIQVKREGLNTVKWIIENKGDQTWPAGLLFMKKIYQSGEVDEQVAPELV